MGAIQPSTGTRKRSGRTNPLRRPIDPGPGDRVATRSMAKYATGRSLNQDSRASIQTELKPGSGSQNSEPELPVVEDSTYRTSPTSSLITSALEESSLSDDFLGSRFQGSSFTQLAGPTTTEAATARRRHNITTYKQRRSVHPLLSSDDKLILRSRQVSRNTDTPGPPSCTPAPEHPALKSRKRPGRHRQMPLKHRLVRAARRRLPLSVSQEAPPQQSVSVSTGSAEEPVLLAAPEETSITTSEDDPVPALEVNIAQRRLVVPQNYTIPDLKDFLGTKSQPLPAEPRIEPQPNPRPQFILPTVNNLRSPRLRTEPKRGRPGRRDLPRLKFVALEAHQEQATVIPGEKKLNQIVETQHVPLSNQVPSVLPLGDSSRQETASHPITHVNFLTPDRVHSPSRVFVKGTPTPEPNGDVIHIYPDIAAGPSFLRTSKSSPARSTHATDVSIDPMSNPAQPSARSFAPMSNLLDDLTKLAKSAAQLNKTGTTAYIRPSLERTCQTNLTKEGCISDSGAGSPMKKRRLK